MTVLTVITCVLRPEMALEAARSVQIARQQAPDWLHVRHTLAYWDGPPNPHAEVADWLTDLIRAAPRGWIYDLDDDNRMHPRFLASLGRAIEAHADAWAFLFGCAYPQFPNGVLTPQLPPRGGHVDAGQAVIDRDYAVRETWPRGGYGDGAYLENLYTLAPHRWVTVNEVVTSHNHQRWGQTWPPDVVTP